MRGGKWGVRGGDGCSFGRFVPPVQLLLVDEEQYGTLRDCLLDMEEEEEEGGECGYVWPHLSYLYFFVGLCVQEMSPTEQRLLCK